jgi:hypothetical protein
MTDAWPTTQISVLESDAAGLILDFPGIAVRIA